MNREIATGMLLAIIAVSSAVVIYIALRVLKEGFRMGDRKKTVDETIVVTVAPPTKPGFYRYSGGGAQTMIFLLTNWGQWFVVSDNGSVSHCVWGYIEQALGVWDLVPIESDD